MKAVRSLKTIKSSKEENSTGTSLDFGRADPASAEICLEKSHVVRLCSKEGLKKAS